MSFLDYAKNQFLEEEEEEEGGWNYLYAPLWKMDFAKHEI